MGKDTKNVLSFASIFGKKVEADFDGGTLTSDGGALFLREVEAQVGVIDRIVAAIRDRRHASYVHHSLRDLLRQRVFQVACGYEDANDCDALRGDPAFKLACERLPESGADLASQPTMTRLENSLSRTALYRIAQALVDTFLASYPTPPKAIILDLDDTDDPTHGAQQLSLFNGYYDEHCYLSLHIYEGQSGKLITTILRPGQRPSGLEIVTILKRVVPYIHQRWPRVRILLRGDSHFSAPEVHEFCDAHRVSFVLGQSGNTRLTALMSHAVAQAQACYQASHEKMRLFTQFAYQADSWSQPRRVIGKVEVSAEGVNLRYVVTNLTSSQPSFIYKVIYCARGRMEGFIKNHKTFLHSDRTSCHRFEANQFRLFLHSAAYVVLHALAQQGLRGTQWAHAQWDTLQLRFLKMGARVRELTTAVKIHYPTAFPLKEVVATIRGNLALASP
jgi:hypothetical protein